jgi:hypothetical protein
MAKKINAMKLEYVSRGRAEAASRRRAPEAALYLMQLQLPKLKNFPAKRQLEIFIDAETRAQIEHPVKIIHVG